MDVSKASADGGLTSRDIRYGSLQRFRMVVRAAQQELHVDVE
jgi:hypothetical protein